MPQTKVQPEEILLPAQPEEWGRYGCRCKVGSEMVTVTVIEEEMKGDAQDGRKAMPRREVEMEDIVEEGSYRNKVASEKPATVTTTNAMEDFEQPHMSSGQPRGGSAEGVSLDNPRKHPEGRHKVKSQSGGGDAESNPKMKQRKVNFEVGGDVKSNPRRFDGQS